MTELVIKDSSQVKAKLRLSLIGGAGAGKTRSAIEIAKHFGKVVVLDTEPGSAVKYRKFAPFKIVEIDNNYHPDLLDKFLSMVENDYDVAIIDNLTHFWSGPGGMLDLIEDEVKRMSSRGKKPDSFAAWKVVDVVYKRMVHRMMTSKCHLITCVRAKMEHVKETDDRGQTRVRKVGMAPEIRDQFVFVNDIEGMLDQDHNLVIGKTRCDEIDGKVFHKPGKEFADVLKNWLNELNSTSYDDDVISLNAAVAARPADVVNSVYGEKESESGVDIIDNLRATIHAIHDDASYQDARTALREAKDAGKLDRAQVNSLALLLNERKEAMDANKTEGAAQ